VDRTLTQPPPRTRRVAVQREVVPVYSAGRVLDAAPVEIVDEVRTADGTYREFGRSKYRRAGI